MVCDMPNGAIATSAKCSIRVFVSHAESDGDLVDSFVELLRSAMDIRHEEIRCTSVDGYRLPTGTEIDPQLRDEIVGAKVFAALLTPTSLQSEYVWFELGARWGHGASLLSLLAMGAEPSSLCGPLKGFAARKSASGEIYQFLGDVARELGLQLHDPHVYQKQFKVFEAAANPDVATHKRSNAALSDYTARDICLELREAPPLERTMRAKRFIGCHVDWDVHFRNAHLEKEMNPTVSASFIPWEDEGFDTAIECDLNLKLYPELKTANEGALFRLTGYIESATDWIIKLVSVKLFPIKDIGGTRVRCLLQAVSRELGDPLCNSVSNRAIEASIRAQLNSGRVEGLTLTDDKTIHPRIDPKSKHYKLLVLKTCKHLIESNPAVAQNVSAKLASLEIEIYNLDNYD